MFWFIILFSFLLFLFHNFYWKRKNLPPGPIPLPILGNLITLAKNSPGYGAFEMWRKTYGDVYAYWLGAVPIVAVADYKLIQETFVKDADSYVGRDEMGSIPELLRGGDYGVVFTQGELWREHRRFAMQVFRNLGMGRNIIEEKILMEFDQLHSDLMEELGDSKQTPINVAHQFEIMVASIINQLLFGFGYHEKSKRQEFAALKDVLSAHMITGFQPLIHMVATTPILRHFPPFKNAMREFKEGYDFLTGYCREQIEKHKARFVPTNEPNDYVEAYLAEMTKNRENFTEIQLVNVLYDIWIAGQETVSNTLIFAVLYSLHNPEKQIKVHQELDSVIGTDRRILSSDKNSLPYLNAFINEVQRLVNLLPQNLIHRATRDVEISGYKIKAGTDILPQISNVLNDEKYFPNPSKFEPERFLDEQKKLKKIDQLIPFSAGKRQCLGESLARTELYLLITNFFNNFEVLPLDKNNLPSLNKKSGVTIQPEQFQCIVKRRY